MDGVDHTILYYTHDGNGVDMPLSKGAAAIFVRQHISFLFAQCIYLSTILLAKHIFQWHLVQFTNTIEILLNTEHNRRLSDHITGEGG